MRLLTIRKIKCPEKKLNVHRTFLVDGNLGEQLAEIGRSADVALQLPECPAGLEMEDYTLPAHIFAIITGNWGENTISF